MQNAPHAADDLGPRLYGEATHNTPAITYTALGAAFVIVGGLASLIPPDPKAPPNAMLIGGLVVAGFGAICLVIGLVRLLPNLGTSWHVHEHGLRLVRRSGERVLRYEDVDELTLKEVRVFFHDVCTGVVSAATFRTPRPAGKLFLKQVRRPNSAAGAGLDRRGELAQACDKVAEMIARRLAARLQRGESIAWVQGIRICPDGLEIDSSSTPPSQIPWSQLERVETEEGKFKLWRRGDDKPVLVVPVELPNFLPGFRLIVDRLPAGG